MKKINIEISIFERGDYVRTLNGVGIVLVDESIVNDEDIRYAEVFVQHKFPSSKNPNNSPMWVDRFTPCLISKEEYDVEED